MKSAAISDAPAVGDRRLALYREMLRIRTIELAIADRYAEQQMRCPVHLSIGQEAVAVGVCAALEPDDRIVCSHRCHAPYLAKGGDLRAMIAELHGKADGCCGGRGGSMHLNDQSAGVLMTVPIVATGVAIGAGAALAIARGGGRGVVVAFVGDAALGQGIFHETLNLAAVWKLPLVIVCENNSLAAQTPLSVRQPDRPLERVGEAHGIRSARGDGNDAVQVLELAAEAVARARAGEGPSFLVFDTYRWLEHVGPEDDTGLGYRSRKALDRWKSRCPVARIERALEEDGLLDEPSARAGLAAVEGEVSDAFAFAHAAAFPAPEPIETPAPAPPVKAEVGAAPKSEMTGAEALLEAMRLAMERDPSVLLLGQGVTDAKAVFGTTTGLAERFGPERVIETPVSESAVTGVAIGAAVMGQRPVIAHQRVEFGLTAFEPLIDVAAKARGLSAGRLTVPMVVRMVIGRGWGQGPTHSQSLESIFSAIPGLKVVMPSTPEDMKGMLIAAIEDDDPVVFLEHRWLHSMAGPVSAGHLGAPLDGPRCRRAGRHATVVATSIMVLEALRAADALAKIGIELEVFDLRVLRPLGLDPVLESVRRTGRLIAIDTGARVLGLGAEIVARTVEACLGALKSPPVRIGLPDQPTPASAALAAAYYPGALDVAEAVFQSLDVAEAKAAGVLSAFKAERNATPVDVPGPTFQGPF